MPPKAKSLIIDKSMVQPAPPLPTPAPETPKEGARIYGAPLNTRVAADVARNLRVFAARRGKKLQYVVEDALRRYMAEEDEL